MAPRRAHRALLIAAAISLSVAAGVEAQLIAEPGPIPAGQKSPAGRYDQGLDALHYDIELALSDLSSDIVARARLRLVATSVGVTSATLDFTGLALDSVRAGGTPTQSVRLEDGLLTVGLGRALGAGEEIDLEFFYRGTPDDGLIILENVEGRPSAFVDNWPNRTRFWLPSLDHPGDKATASFTVHAPTAWTVIANGRPIGQPYPTPAAIPGPATSGTRRTWVYRTDVPHPTYTLVVGAAELVVDDVGLAGCGQAPASARPDGCVEVTTWLYPESAEGGAASFVRAAEMLDFFTSLVGPFPYEKLAHVQSATRFGGMENSSAIFYSEAAIARGADIEGTVSHETAHQWFGDSVTQTDWAHLWLSEGFATYFGALFFEYADGPDRFQELVQGVRDRYLASGDSLRPVVDTEQQDLFALLNRNSYQKGGLILHMLRAELGEEDFFAGIRLYYERHRDGNALTADLQAALEESSGLELSTFFEQWLHRPGHPVLRASADTDPETGGLRLTVTQVQGDYAPRYELLLPIGFGDGAQEIQRVRMEGAQAVFTFPEIPPGTAWRLDPRGELLARIEGSGGQ